jgi:hypothetical protein
MTALSIQPTFPIFTDIDGQPLEDGYVFIGTANLNPITNPITVYWDAALTLAAAQPIRTLGGYPMNSGTPARLYVNSDYSIQVQNKNGSLIYSALAAGDRFSGVVVDISSTDVSFIQAGSGAVTRTAQAKMRDIIDARDFGAVSDGVTNNTAAVQSAINSIGVYGGTVYIPDGAKFNLRSLTFPARFNLDYRADDDLSQAQLPGFTIASSERVLFSSNSSYPADPTGAVVNEWRLTAPFHPGLIIDARKDLGANIAPYLAPGQTINNPVRASFNIADEQNGVFRIAYENYLTPTNFAGLFLHGYRNTVRLNGIGTAQWTSVPAAGVLVTGTTSGAKGFVLTVAAGYTDLLWFSGDFVAGETVSDNNETTTATITSVVYSEAVNVWIAQDLETGAWTIGDHPPGVGSETLNVSGNAKVVPTRGGATNVPKSVTNPVYVWGDNPEGGSHNVIGLMYPTTGNAALRRLQAVRQDLTTSTGAIVPVSVMVNVNNALAVDTHAVNVSTITKTATGKYTITFTNNLARALPVYTLSLDGFHMQNWWAGVTFPTVSSCQVWVKDNTGAFADLPAGAQVGLVGLGADI